MIGSLCVLISVIMIGCGTLPAVKVSLSNYNPVLTEDQSAYKGKQAYLMNFDNQANDTSIWYYYSLDNSFYYYCIDKPLTSYFWYAFQGAFLKAGLLVSDMDNPDLKALAMWVTLLSITDEHFRVKVWVKKNGAYVLTEIYSIEEPPLSEKERSPSALEQRAYKMTNKLIETILGDPRFRKVMTEP
jgi:hypothetical protein